MFQHFIETGRGRFSVWDTEDTGNVTLVMLHGWPQCAYCWQPIQPYLQDRYRLVCPDLRGLGESNRTNDLVLYEKHNLAKDVAALLESLSIDQYVVVGHDWGGVVAQEMAILFPDQVQALMLLNIAVINNWKGNRAVIKAMRARSPASFWYQHFQRVAELPEAMIKGNESVWLRYFLRSWTGTSLPEEAITTYIDMYEIAGTPATGANYYRAFPADAKRWQALKSHRFMMPSLYLYGNKDPVIIPETLLNIEDCFEQIEVAQFEVGHFVQEEAPDQVGPVMREFLDRLAL